MPWKVILVENRYIYSCNRCGYSFEVDSNDTCELRELIVSRVCYHEQIHLME